MSRRRLSLFASIGLCLLPGCSTFTQKELAQLHQSPISPTLALKFSQAKVLTPSDVVELTRTGVPEKLIIRQIDSTGLDYTLEKGEPARLVKSGVSPKVVEAMIIESDHFNRNFAPGFGPHYVSPYEEVVATPGNPYRYTDSAVNGVGFSGYRGPQTYNPYVWRQ